MCQNSVPSVGKPMVKPLSYNNLQFQNNNTNNIQTAASNTVVQKPFTSIYDIKGLSCNMPETVQNNELRKQYKETITNEYNEIIDKYVQKGYKKEILPKLFIENTGSYYNAAFVPEQGVLMCDESIDRFCKYDLLGNITPENLTKIKTEQNTIMNIILNPELKNRMSSLSDSERIMFHKFFIESVLTHEFKHFEQFALITKVFGPQKINEIYEQKREQQFPKLDEYKVNEEFNKLFPNVTGNNLSLEQKHNTIEAYYKDIVNKYYENDPNLKIYVNSFENKSFEDELSKISAYFSYQRNFNASTQIDEMKFYEILACKKYRKNETLDKYSAVWWSNIYNVLKEQPITEEERLKANQYVEAYKQYAHYPIEEKYFNSILEQEAYTEQVAKAFEKFDKYKMQQVKA